VLFACGPHAPLVFVNDAGRAAKNETCVCHTSLAAQKTRGVPRAAFLIQYLCTRGELSVRVEYLWGAVAGKKYMRLRPALKNSPSPRVKKVNIALF
jgi:hypothetical protein